MKKIVDIDKLKEICDKIIMAGIIYDTDKRAALNYVNDWLEAQPDAEEVIHCKDCKHFMIYTEEYKQKADSADGDCYLKVMYGNNERFAACRLNDFCSCAEREENEKDS